MLVSYHNHTLWSDGKSTIAELVAEAERIGLDELGISDHYVLHPADAIDWSIPLDRYDEYVAELRESAEATAKVKVRVGVEADYFPETVDALREVLAAQPLDFVIGSVHFVDGFPIDESAEHWDRLSATDIDDVWRLYWIRIAELAKSRVYDFLAHPDLPKKFGHRPMVDLSSEIGAALDAVAEAGMSIEINTAGWHKPVGEAYPSIDILQEAGQRGIPLLINSDAHEASHLTRDFERARELARRAGYSELVSYSGRKAHSYGF